VAPGISNWGLAVLAVAGTIAAIESRGLARAWRAPVLAGAAAVVGALAIYRWAGSEMSWPVLALVALALAAGIAARRWRATACIAAYAVGILYLSMLGLASDRLAGSFAILLWVGVALLLIEARADPTDERAPPLAVGIGVPAAVGAAVLFLYAGSFVVPSPIRDGYLGEVHGKPGMAIKIADDARIDRSLYLISDRRMIYTRHDAADIGAVRKYGKLANDRWGNLSFVDPNAFVD